jgi:SAM-dependent methyltransferase
MHKKCNTKKLGKVTFFRGPVMKLRISTYKKSRNSKKEVEPVDLKKWDLDFFNRGYVENPKFWSRLGGAPCLKGLKVLEIGCGHGSLCVDIANKGAEKVIGIDINRRRIKFANANVAKFFPRLQNKIEYRCCSTSGVNESNFDVIVSKDTFEHILNLDKELIEMKKRLKSDGKIYVGFGPLFHSYFGSHRITNKIIPWGHLLIPESVLIKTHPHFGLNRLSLKQFLGYFKKSGFVFSYFRINADTFARGNEKAGLQIFSLLSRLSPLREYFSCNLYCILNKNE